MRCSSPSASTWTALMTRTSRPGRNRRPRRPRSGRSPRWSANRCADSGRNTAARTRRGGSGSSMPCGCWWGQMRELQPLVSVKSKCESKVRSAADDARLRHYRCVWLGTERENHPITVVPPRATRLVFLTTSLRAERGARWPSKTAPRWREGRRQRGVGLRLRVPARPDPGFPLCRRGLATARISLSSSRQ